MLNIWPEYSIAAEAGLYRLHNRIAPALLLGPTTKTAKISEIYNNYYTSTVKPP